MYCLNIQCEFWCTRIIQHISGFSFHSQVFRLTMKVWFPDVNPHKKKILPHLYILELSQPMNICTEIINFFPLSFGPNILHALQISGLEIPDHRMADAFPTALLLSFWEYHIPFSGTDTLYQVQTSTQGWKGMFFHTQPHLPYSSASGKMHWSEPERMGFLLIFYQPLGTAPSHS